jgi:hypothetical protein
MSKIGMSAFCPITSAKTPKADAFESPFDPKEKFSLKIACSGQCHPQALPGDLYRNG